MLRSNFFSGETSPEEEADLRINAEEGSVEEVYFSALKEAKKEQFDLDFDAFLEKAEGQATPQKKIQPVFQNIYWMAAALALVLGSYFVIQQSTQPELTDQQTQIVASVSTKPAATVQIPEKSETAVATNYMPKDFPLTSKKQVIKKRNRMRLAQNIPVEKITLPVENINEEDYNPNYVVVNGRAITNEEEALNYTKEAFTFFAKNMTHTLETANIENLSE